MKKTLIILVLFLIAVYGPVSAQPTTQLWQGELPRHPRILMTAGAEEKILRNIASSATWKNIHEDILSECDKMLVLPLPERKKIGMRLLAVSRESLRRIFFLSYAYRMTGEGKYFRRAEKELLAVSRFSDWNPSHFLDVAEMTLGVSIGYDWLFYKLSNGSKKLIREAIIQKGLLPSFDKKYNWFLEAKHNWNQVCNAGMTFGALAVCEEDTALCKKIIGRSVSSVALPMKEYGPDGAYPEGYAYWEYGTSFNVLLLDVLEKAFPGRFTAGASNGFMRTAAYYQFMTGISGNSFNYADCGEEYGVTPAMFWFARKADDLSLLWVEKKFLNTEYRDNYLSNRILPVIMIWASGIDTGRITSPGKKVWVGRGITPVALMRTSWTDPDAIYAGFKGGTASSNHAHMDAGSFVMEADGVRWAMDFGKQDYESLESKKLNIWTNDQDSERWKVYRYNNFVHNTLTVNDRLHSVSGYAPITATSDNDNFMSAVCDLSPVFKGELSSAKRGIAVVDKKYVMIRDEVTALPDTPATVRWTMLTVAVVKSTGKNHIELEKDGKKLSVRISGNYPVKIKTWNTRSPNDYDADNTGTVRIGFESLIPAGVKAYFSVNLIPSGISCDTVKNKSLDQWPVKKMSDN